jgi:hypothetical protein
MINHARTLLMNVDGASFFQPYVGEEILPATYVAKDLTGYLGTIRNILFGSDPDRHMRNYRCRQYMSMLHSTDLVEFVTDLDPRISYDFDDNPFFNDNLYAITSSQTGTSVSNVEVSIVRNDDTPPDPQGILKRSWRLVHDGSTGLDIHYKLNTGIVVESPTISVESGITSPISLPGSLTQIRLTANGSPVTWSISKLQRPSYDLGQIEMSLRSVGTETLSNLFGVGTSKATTEPFKTFKALWEGHRELPYKLGGLLLAVIYQTDEVLT